MPIWKVNDGSIWHFDAESQRAARAQWVMTVRAVLKDYDEPEITPVMMIDAAEITVTTDESDPCPLCGGCGLVDHEITLLDAYRENQKAPPEKKAKHGALCNSEWP